MLKELAVPACLILILCSIILPLPPLMLDFLLIGNLIFALTLLASSFYLTDSLKLSALPSILLLATLFRLSLNVATTRSILGIGEAGQVIEAFGRVLIGGNLVVGVVVFLVITFIQFIVIAKGSERVAEVAARFTLDALPGKQMSIDADVRAGLIDFETARRRRNELQTESRFYGALDGAMKFIKGDAIAGIVIAGVNILGGLATGLLMEGLPIQRALAKYTLLTIGDGMLSQVPALLNALAAGMVVTRVSRGGDETLASELFGQLGQVRRARFLIAFLAVGLGFIPGMPLFPFVMLAGVLLTGSVAALRRPATEEKKEEVHFTPKVPALLHVELDRESGGQIYDKGGIAAQIQRFRQRVYDELGLVLAAPDFTVSAVKEKQFSVRLRGLVIQKHSLAGCTPEQVRTVVFEKLHAVVQSCTAELVDDLLTRRILDQFEKEAPELVSAVIPEMISVTQLSEILRALIKEGLAVRNFDLILQAIAEASPKGSTPSVRALLEEVRVALRRLICERYLASDGLLHAYTLDPALDLMFARTEREGQPLDTECLAFVCRFLEKAERTQSVLLVSKAARALLRDCLELRKISIPVLAHDELTGEVQVKNLGLIELSDPELEEQVVNQLAA